MEEQAVRRSLWIASGLVLLAVLGGFGLAMYWRSPGRGLPYHDRFASSSAEEWRSFGGTWEVVNGTMRNDSDERGAKLMTGSAYWQDYSVEADVMLLGPNGDAGLIARASHEEEGVDAYDGYYAGLRIRDNALTLGRAGYGWMETVFPFPTRQVPVQVSRWYHLKLLVYGCQIVASAAALPAGSPVVASITDENCIRSGRAGLRSYSSGGVWRNVVVRPVTQHDVDLMLMQRRPQQSAPGQQSAAEIALAPPQDNRPIELASSPNAQAISSLHLAALAVPQTATIRGSVTLTSPQLFVQDATGGVAVHLKKPQPLKVGDEVEVTGTVKGGAFSSTMEDATVRVLWESTPMPAVAVTASQAATGAFDAMFVEVSGRLRHKEYGPGDTILFDFDSGPQSFRAVMNQGRGNYLYDRLKLNSLLRLRGVSVVDPVYTQSVAPFAVLLRSSDDVEVIAGPPWWSAGHLVAIVIGILLVALIINFLYHRLESMRLRAVVEEREHLAYEMHDTLAQSVAGIGFQLEAIRAAMPEDLSKVHRQLDFASELVRHSHAEARRSIDMLRPQQLESEGLLHALTSCAERLVEGGAMRIIGQSSGDVRPVPLRVADVFYRIGQEAIANAVRHARSSVIVISLAYLKHAVQLTIEDNGCGFNVEEDVRGLGIQGMRRRAASISGKLEIYGSEGNGTRVVATAPLPARVTWISFPAVLWKFVKERTRNATIKANPHPYR
jgi:signal transduction histidine kinase